MCPTIRVSLAAPLITTHTFASWSISVMVSSPNDCRKPLVNHVQNLSLSKITTCTLVHCSSKMPILSPVQPVSATIMAHKFNATHMSSACVLSRHACTLVRPDFLCELYMPCPHIMIHTHVYYYKMAAYADKQACAQLTIQTQKIVEFFIFSSS